MYIDDALKYISFPCQKSLIDDTLISLSNDCLSDWMIPQFFFTEKKNKKRSLEQVVESSKNNGSQSTQYEDRTRDLSSVNAML